MAVYKSIVRGNSIIQDNKLVIKSLFQGSVSVFTLDPKLKPSGLSSKGSVASFRITTSEVFANGNKAIVIYSTHGVPLIFNFTVGSPKAGKFREYLEGLGRDYSLETYQSPIPISANRMATLLVDMVNTHPQLTATREENEVTVTYKFVGRVRPPSFVDDNCEPCEISTISDGFGAPIERELQWIKLDSAVSSGGFDISYNKKVINNFNNQYQGITSFSQLNQLFKDAMGEKVYITKTVDDRGIFVYFLEDGQKYPIYVINNSTGVKTSTKTLVQGGPTSEPISINLNQFRSYTSDVVVDATKYTNDAWSRRGWAVEDSTRFGRQLKAAIENNIRHNDPNKDWNVIIVQSEVNAKHYTVVLIYPGNQGTIVEP